MPFNIPEDAKVWAPMAAQVRPQEDATQDVGLVDQLKGAFARDNTLVSAVRGVFLDPAHTVDPDFNPVEHMTPAELLRYSPGQIAGITSGEDLKNFRDATVNEDRWRMQEDNGPLPGWLASMVASVADPINFLPFGGAALAGRGATLGARLLAGAAGAALDVGLSESVLQATQRTRTTEESLSAIAFGGVLGAGFAGAGAALGRRLVPEVGKEFKAVAETALAHLPAGGEASAGAAQAIERAVWARMTAEDTELVGQKFLEPTMNALGRLRLAAPGLQLASSSFSELRKLARMTVDIFAVSKGEAKGNVLGAAPLDLRVRALDADIAQAQFGIRVAHAEAKKGGYTAGLGQFKEDVGNYLITGASTHAGVAKAGDAVRSAIYEPWLKRLQDSGVWEAKGFSDKVDPNYANRVYDRDAIIRNPGFRATVEKWLRDEIERYNTQGEAIAGYKRELGQKQGLESAKLANRGKDLQRARRAEQLQNVVDRNELTRMRRQGAEALRADRERWRQRKANGASEAELKAIQESMKRGKEQLHAQIDKRRLEIEDGKLRRREAHKNARDILKDDIRAHREKWKELNRKSDEKTPKWFADWRDAKVRNEPEDAAQIASDIENSILGTGGAVGSNPIPGARGPLKGRTLSIPNELIAPWLEKDVDKMMERYIKSAGNDLETYRTFGTFDYNEIVAPAMRERDAMLAAAKNEKERVAIHKKFDRQLTQFEHMFAQVRDAVPPPRYAGIARVAANLRTLNFTRALGSVLASQVPDLGAITLQHGVMRTLGTVLGDLALGARGLRMSRKDAQLMGAALDFTMNRRALRAFDSHTEALGAGKFTKGVQYLGQVQSALTGMSAWTEGMETIASALASTDILKLAEKVATGKGLSKVEKTRMAMHKLDEDMLRRFHDERANWQDVTGALGGVIRSGNVGAWKDKGAAEAFKLAVLRNTEASVISPGAGDVPAWMNYTVAGKMIGQFRKFQFAAVNRLLVPGAQRMAMGDIRAWSGIAATVGFGALSALLADKIMGEPQGGRNTANLVKDAIDKSGILGFYFEMEGFGEKQFGFSPSKALTGQELTRFQDRTGLEAAAGPTAGFALDISRMMQGATTKDFTMTDLHRARRLLPFQNLIWTRKLVDAAEKSLGQSLNLRDTAKK